MPKSPNHIGYPLFWVLLGFLWVKAKHLSKCGKNAGQCFILLDSRFRGNDEIMNTGFNWIPAFAGTGFAGMTNKMGTILHYLLGFWVFPMENKALRVTASGFRNFEL